jgi:hypothetical protein
LCRRSDVSRTDQNPEPAGTAAAAEWDLSSETASKIFEIVLAMRAKCGLSAAIFAGKSIDMIVVL